MTQPAQTDHDQKVQVRRRYQHFAMVPVGLVRASAISAQAVRAFALLDSYCSWDTNRAHPAHDRLAEDMGVSVPTLRRAIKELADAGYVSVEGVFDFRGARTGTIYTLNDPQGMQSMQVMQSGAHEGETPCSPVITPSVIAGQGDQCSPVITEVLASEQTPAHGRHPIHIDRESALLFEEDTPTSASGESGRRQEINTARAPARERKTTDAHACEVTPRGPKGNPDILPLLTRHADLYRDKVGALFPVAWSRDGGIVKRLLGTYTRTEIEYLQDAFFAQGLDSPAARRGYTVAQLAYEAPALMTAIKLREGLTQEQEDLISLLEAEGITQQTAIALVRECETDAVRAQITAHTARRDRFANPAAALVKAIREGWTVSPVGDEPDYFQPILVGKREGAVPPPPEVQALFNETLTHLTGKKANA